jgi:predicted ATPase/DNA-binding CsgD family transcriptional regulator
VFVALAPISDSSLVVSAIASAAGLRESGSADLAGLSQWLRTRELLLLLDNFEQVVDAAPDVARLLRECAGVKVLATSRGLFRISGEHGFALPPLPVPEVDAVGEPDAKALLAIPAVALFTDRARASWPDFDPLSDTASVASLCRRLDGLPLAIELAAASVRLLTPAAMLERLEHGRSVLAAANRDSPDRHLSLTRAIGWSYELLSEGQRRLFRRLSVFTGGCTVDAAEAIADAGDEFLELLDGLVSQSLVRIETSGRAVRVVMLETIAECGRDWLAASGEDGDAHDAHAACFLAVAEGARDEMRSARREDALQSLERDHANLRAALAHLQSTRPDAFAQMAAALARFWQELGYLDEGRRWIVDAMQATAESPPELGMPVVLGAALVAYEDDRVEDAAALADTAADYFRRAGDARRLIEAAEILAAVDRFRGAHSAAADRYAEAAALARDIGDEWLIAHLTERDGQAAWVAGEYDRANAALSESLMSFRRMGDSQGAAFALWELGSVDAQDGRLEIGISRLEEAVPILRRGRHRRQLARTLCNLGVAYLGVGDVARAESALVEGTLTFRDVKLGRHVSAMFPAFAAISTARGSHARAALLLGATEQAWDAARWKAPVMLDEMRVRCTDDVRRHLGTEAFESSRAEGRAMSLEEALAEAIRPEQDRQAGLTARELEIVQLLAEGLSNAEISAQLFVSVRTVHAHLRSLYSKLGVGSRTAAVRSASDLGIVTLARTV